MEVFCNNFLNSGLPNMDSKDVEEIFKDVLTEEPQNSHEPITPDATNNSIASGKYVLNKTPTVVANQQQGVIIQHGPPIMSPSHSGKEPVNWCVKGTAARWGE